MMDKRLHPTIRSTISLLTRPEASTEATILDRGIWVYGCLKKEDNLPHFRKSMLFGHKEFSKNHCTLHNFSCFYDWLELNNSEHIFSLFLQEYNRLQNVIIVIVKLTAEDNNHSLQFTDLCGPMHTFRTSLWWIFGPPCNNNDIELKFSADNKNRNVVASVVATKHDENFPAHSRTLNQKEQKCRSTKITYN